MTWQPMSTAPRDGTYVYVTVDHYGKRYTMEGRYRSGAQSWVCDNSYTPESHVLAWAPILPKPAPYTGPVEDLEAIRIDPRDAEIERLRAENARLREAMPTDEERYGLGMALDSARPAFLVVFPWLARLDAARKEVL